MRFAILVNTFWNYPNWLSFSVRNLSWNNPTNISSKYNFYHQSIIRSTRIEEKKRKIDGKWMSIPPSVLKTMCQVSPGASSPVIFVLSRHLPRYGVLGLNLFTTTPSSCFLDSFSTLAGASVVTWALMETTLPLLETSLYCNGAWERNHNSYHYSDHLKL